MTKVITVQGDTWDTVAKRVYGRETLAQLLMEARENIRLLDYQVFPSGIRVAVPEAPAETELDLPAWRK